MFISDERGMVEPNSDLVSMALAVIGFVIFFSTVAHVYQVHQEKTYIVQHYDDAASLAGLLIRDSKLTATDRPDLIDAFKIESLTSDQIRELKHRYGNVYDFSFKIEVPPTYSETIGTCEDMGVSASVPVTIRLNEACEKPGTFTVKIWEK